MSSILKSKKALSTVVTTLIILVVSVLLATVVTFYAINMTTTRTQQESLYMSNTHVWYNTTGGWAEAAFVLINTGGRDVVLQKITARSQTSDWNNVYYWTTNTAAFSALSVTTTQPSGASISPTINGTFTQTLSQATDVITLKAGYSLVVYVNHPDSVQKMDVGTSIPVAVVTANAQWPQEVNVEAAQ